MSKAVKSVGRAVSGVVKGVSNVVKGVVSKVGGIVKKIASSKLGKVLIAAAAIYFGGAAIMGGIQGAAAGSGFMGTLSGAISGAGTGIANAWAGLTSATSAALGGNFAQAGSALSSGAMGQAPISVASGMAAPTAAMTGAAAAPAAAGAGTAASTAASTAAGTAASTAGAGTAASGFSSLSPLAQYGIISGGSQLVGGAIQGYGQQKTMEEQRAYEEEQARLARERMDQNMSAQFQFGQPGDSNYTPPPQPGGVPYPMMPGQPSPMTMNTGLIRNQMPQAPQRQQFPIYNPMLAQYGYR